jgi:hypothetical protein
LAEIRKAATRAEQSLLLRRAKLAKRAANVGQTARCGKLRLLLGGA